MKYDQPGQLLLSSMKLRLEILTELILSFNEGKLKTERGKVSSFNPKCIKVHFNEGFEHI